ncbi:MAG: LOG family protein [Bacteroidetes bacterium]|nr:LOG family protein [Bacteroidota bacterium]
MPLTYHDTEFMNSDAARELRILSEYLYPEHQFTKKKISKAIIIYGSARILPLDVWTKKHEELKQKIAAATTEATLDVLTTELRAHEAKREYSLIYEECVQLSEMLCEWSMKLPKEKRFYICTGGGPGIMEAANRGAYNKKTQTLGFNISLPYEQFPNPYITKDLNFEFYYFFMRKFWFSNLAEALVAMPGGFGTFDEIVEQFTLIQTKKITKKMPVVLYKEDFWRKVFNFEYLAEIGMISHDDLFLYKYCSTPDEAFEYITKKLTEYHNL